MPKRTPQGAGPWDAYEVSGPAWGARLWQTSWPGRRSCVCWSTTCPPLGELPFVWVRAPPDVSPWRDSMMLDVAWESAGAAALQTGELAVFDVLAAERAQQAVAQPGWLRLAAVVGAAEGLESGAVLELAVELEPVEKPALAAVAPAEPDTAPVVAAARAVGSGRGSLGVAVTQGAPGMAFPAEVAASVAAGAYQPDSRARELAAAAPDRLAADFVRPVAASGELHLRMVAVPATVAAVVEAVGIAGAAEERMGSQVVLASGAFPPLAVFGAACPEPVESGRGFRRWGRSAEPECPAGLHGPALADTAERWDAEVSRAVAAADIPAHNRAAEVAGRDTAPAYLAVVVAAAGDIEVGPDTQGAVAAAVVAAVDTGSELAAAEAEPAQRPGARVETAPPPASHIGGSYTAGSAAGHGIRISCSGTCS